MLRFLSAGESHGQALVITLDGMPAGLDIDTDALNAQLRGRQGGYGPGRRLAIQSARDETRSIDDEPSLRCVDEALQQKMMAFIDALKELGDTVGPSFEVIATGVPP